MHDIDRSFLELDPTHAVASEFWSAPANAVGREMTQAAGGAPAAFVREMPSTAADAPSPFARELARMPNQEVFDGVTEMELAAELLGAQSDQEMEFFLGGLLQKVGGLLHSTVGKEILGGLKGLARNALPVAGAALGNLIAPGAGGNVGRMLAGGAGKALGLELEGMSPADQEFEVARRVVRLGAQAARHAAGVTPATEAEAARVAQAALAAAAREVAPGLLRQAPATVPAQGIVANPGERRTGRWVRQGDRILLIGV